MRRGPSSCPEDLLRIWVRGRRPTRSPVAVPSLWGTRASFRPALLWCRLLARVAGDSSSGRLLARHAATGAERTRPSELEGRGGERVRQTGAGPPSLPTTPIVHLLPARVWRPHVPRRRRRQPRPAEHRLAMSGLSGEAPMDSPDVGLAQARLRSRGISCAGNAWGLMSPWRRSVEARGGRTAFVLAEGIAWGPDSDRRLRPHIAP